MKTKNEIVYDMCLTYRHDYDILPTTEQENIWRMVVQIFDNCIKNNLKTKSTEDANVDQLSKCIRKIRKQLERIETVVKEYTVDVVNKSEAEKDNQEQSVTILKEIDRNGLADFKNDYLGYYRFGNDSRVFVEVKFHKLELSPFYRVSIIGSDTRPDYGGFCFTSLERTIVWNKFIEVLKLNTITRADILRLNFEFYTC